jgi:hypothetical protein
MADESNVLPASRIVRWVAIGVLIVFAVVLYFREGRHVPPLAAPGVSPAPAAASTGQSPR